MNNRTVGILPGMRERVAYLHIPKSAGTSIRRAMLDHVSAEQICPWSLDPVVYGSHPLPVNASERLFHEDVTNLRDYAYMAGHLSLPTIERGFEAADVGCILREPRSRLLSQYAFWRTYSPEELEYWLPYEAPSLSHLPLGEFLQCGEVMHFADNLTARLIVGRHPLIPIDDPIADEHVEEVAAIACSNLDRLGFVDVLERGDLATERFEVWFGESVAREKVNVTDPNAGPPINVDDLLSTPTLQLLDRHSQVDSLLWLHVASTLGMDERQARRLGDATFASSVAKVARRALAASNSATDISEEHGVVDATFASSVASAARRAIAAPFRLERGKRKA